jgi:hypothetical protein
MLQELHKAGGALMVRSAFLALAFVPLLSGGNVRSVARFKEAVCVQISAPAGTQSPRLRLTVKGQGVRVYKSNCGLPLNGTFITSDTLTAPEKLFVVSIGAGEAELVALDPAVKYTVLMEPMATGQSEANTVTASHILIGHADMQHPFSIRSMDSSGR